MHPKSDAEWVFCILIFLAGVVIFSIIMSNFTEILFNIIQTQSEYEEDEQLSIFIDTLNRYNRNIPISEKFQNDLLSFFNYKW